MKKKLINFLCVFLVFMLLFTILSRAADSMTVAQISVSKPQKGKITHEVSASGKVVQNREQAVSTEPNQVVKTIYVEEGQQVQAGDVLFELDLEELKEQILKQKQEMKKEELRSEDAASGRDAKEWQKAVTQSRVVEDYNVAAGKSGTAVSRAYQQLQNAKKQLKAFDKAASADSSGGTDEVALVLQQAVTDKQAEYEQALQEKETLESEIDEAVERALADAKEGKLAASALPVAQELYHAANGETQAEADLPEPITAAAPVTAQPDTYATEAPAELLAVEPHAAAAQPETYATEAVIVEPQAIAAQPETYATEMVIAEPQPVTETTPSTDIPAADTPSFTTNDSGAPGETVSGGDEGELIVDDGLLVDDIGNAGAVSGGNSTSGGTHTGTAGGGNGSAASGAAGSGNGSAASDAAGGADTGIIPDTDASRAPTQAELDLLEKRIRQQNQFLLDEADDLIRQKEKERDEAQRAFENYFQSSADSRQSSLQSTREQLMAQVTAAQQAYEDALTAQGDSLRTAGRSIEDANAPEATDSTGEIDAISREQAELQLAKLERLMENDGKVTSPITGVITKQNLITGERTPDGTAILLADTTDGSKLQVQVPKSQDKYIARGDAVVIKPDNSKKTIEGLTVDSVRVSETDENLLDVTVRLPGDTELEIGTMAQFSCVKTSEVYDVTVPVQALHQDNQQYFVYVTEEKQSVLGNELTVRRVDVNVLDKNEQTAAVSGGLLSGQAVITSADKYIESGSRVRLKE